MTLDVLPGPRLADRTTLRLGGTTLAEVVLTGPDDAAGLASTLAGLGGTPLVLGGGSNILARDGALPLVVISPPDQGRARDPAPAVRRQDPGAGRGPGSSSRGWWPGWPPRVSTPWPAW